MNNTFKRFKQPSPEFRIEESMPARLKKALEIIAINYMEERSRNMDVMRSKYTIYAQMTHYEGQNFCWIQPTLRPNMNDVDVEYDSYIKRANSSIRKGKLENLRNIQIGMDCLAKYESDGNLYRAVIVNQCTDDDWEILFVDYGNFQRTNSEMIYDILNEPRGCHYYPRLQAVCTHIYNIVSRHPDVRPEIDGYLERIYAKNVNNFMIVKVKEIRRDYVVNCDLFLVDKKLIPVKIEDLSYNMLYRKHIGQSIVDEGKATFENPLAAYSIKQALHEDTDVKTDIKME